MILGRVDLSNLLYVFGALVAATVVSAVYALRHRKPRSMEAGIRSFSDELRALAPDRRSDRGAGRPGQVEPAGIRSTAAPAGAGQDHPGRSTRARDPGDAETG